METSKILALVCDGTKKHPKTSTTHISYGTAGFRTKSSMLDHIMYRMGVLATIRANFTKASVGVMITASHNPEEDNGVKLVDPSGEMLNAEWEGYATLLANLSDEDVGAYVKELLSKVPNMTHNPVVFVGRDTRGSSYSLKEATLDGIKAVYGPDTKNFIDLGEITTPMIHYAVSSYNFSEDKDKYKIEHYYEKLTSAFRSLLAMEPVNEKPGKYKPAILVDAANGVGAAAMNVFKSKLHGVLDITIINDGSSGKLNHECGADFVKVKQQLPANVPSVIEKGASLDGDADRVMYFFTDANNKPQFRILDGDKILTLIAVHLNSIVKKCSLDLRVGVVQTAYANGSSTKFLSEQNLEILCVPTGVKHLHHAAQKFDIGVYFEANGHGTVVFSHKALRAINRAYKDEGIKDAQRLYFYTKVINSTVGDAISDMLLVEAILFAEGMSPADWDSSYKDFPNRQLKVSIADRNMVKTTNAERHCVAPDGLQEKIDAAVSQYKNGRSFVRPSGTEDVVRVYAEADTQQNADNLAKEVAALVYDLCNGIGEKP